jgi:superfamily II DNA or RNA helicase
MELRPYQEFAIQKLRESLMTGNKRVMLYSSTGSGKTEIAMAMIKAALTKKKRTIFVVNRVELINQTSRRFYKSNIQHGIIQGANTRMSDSDALVCSIQTMAKRGYPDADFIVIDEGHYCAGSKSYVAMIEHYKDKPIIALSATPFSKGLAKKYEWGVLFQDLVIATTVEELIEQGYLVDLDIYAPDKPDLSKVRTTAGDWNEKDLGVECDKPILIGNIVKHWKELGENKPTVCFAVNIAHSKHIVEDFLKNGVTAEHVDCYTSEDDRKAILDRVLSGQTKVISNVGILTTGWDFPACEVMILARPTKSLILWIQMAGRILRPFEGKAKGKLLDHSGTAELLGFPTDDLPLFLDDGKPKQTTGSDKKIEKPLPKPCPKCSYLKKKAGACPICKFAPVKQSGIEVGEGKLKILTKKEKAKEAKLAGLDKQHVYSELLYMAREKNYKSGWAANQYRTIWGVWPRGLEEKTRIPSLQVQNMVRTAMIRFHKGNKNAEA